MAEVDELHNEVANLRSRLDDAMEEREDLRKEVAALRTTHVPQPPQGGEAAKLAEALVTAEWANVSIGNKALLARAVEILQAATPHAAPVAHRELTDADINDMTLHLVGDWPSFEAQSWACKVVHAIVANAAPEAQMELGAGRSMMLEQGNHTMTKQKVSKLSELTRAQADALEARFIVDKSRWRSRLLEDFATGKDQNNPALRQLRNERLPWLQTVTSADFELPIVVHYGTIACEHGAKPALAALGVEVGDYDYEQGRYYVRVNAASYKELAPYAQDFPVDALHTFDDNAHLPRDLSQCETSLLKAAAARYAYRIHSDENDGRVTAGGSAALDWWLEQAEKIDTELASRARAVAMPPAGQPVAADASPTP